MTISVFWDMAPCGSCKGTILLHHPEYGATNSAEALLLTYCNTRISQKNFALKLAVCELSTIKYFISLPFEPF
jgi:hypothetical protein